MSTADATGARGAAGAAGRGADTASVPAGQRVLVVENDAVLRDLLVQALALEGIGATGAGDPAQALALCGGAVPFAAVLLDWRSGDAAGPRFAAGYGALPAPQAPIVLLTVPGDDVAAADRIAVRGVLTKPFDLQDLVETVQRCVVFAPDACQSVRGAPEPVGSDCAG